MQKNIADEKYVINEYVCVLTPCEYKFFIGNYNIMHICVVHYVKMSQAFPDLWWYVEFIEYFT